MSLEHLLFWLSAKGQGSWSQFRGAVEELYAGQDQLSLEADDAEVYPSNARSDLPVYQLVRFALERLGHVEFLSNEAGKYWRVVPPALALFPTSAYEGVLCGARSPELLHRLESELEVARVTAAGMPDRIVVRGSPEAVARGAARLGLLVQMDAPMAILSAVPAIRDPVAWSPMPIPANRGWMVQRFFSSRLVWAESSEAEALNARTGLFRFVMGFQRFHFLRWQGCSYRVPVQVGKYVVMGKRSALLRYHTPSVTLSVPAVCRPPLLIERALILCSGRLPSFSPVSRRLEYVDVLFEVALLAAQLLRQEIVP